MWKQNVCPKANGAFYPALCQTTQIESVNLCFGIVARHSIRQTVGWLAGWLLSARNDKPCICLLPMSSNFDHNVSLNLVGKYVTQDTSLKTRHIEPVNPSSQFRLRTINIFSNKASVPGLEATNFRIDFLNALKIHKNVMCKEDPYGSK